MPIQLIPPESTCLGRFLELVNYSVFEERLIVLANYTNKQFGVRAIMVRVAAFVIVCSAELRPLTGALLSLAAARARLVSVAGGLK